MSLGKNIKLCRINANMKQKELAKLADTNSSYLSLVESGKAKPSLTFVEKIAVALGVSFYVLFLENENPAPKGSESKLTPLSAFHGALTSGAGKKKRRIYAKI
mgnify:CR=1 FL=1